MLFFKNKKEELSEEETKCTGCKCATCRNMKYSVCDYKFNECTTNKFKDCKIKSCDMYKK